VRSTLVQLSLSPRSAFNREETLKVDLGCALESVGQRVEAFTQQPDTTATVVHYVGDPL